MAKSPKQETAVVVTKTYDVVLWVLNKVEHFPRAHRFSLGERLMDAALDLLMTLVQAAYATEKVVLLRQASLKTNCLRYLLRLAKDVRLINLDAYSFSTEKVEEIGRMIGGWQKSLARRA